MLKGQPSSFISHKLINSVVKKFNLPFLDQWLSSLLQNRHDKVVFYKLKSKIQEIYCMFEKYNYKSP